MKVLTLLEAAEALRLNRNAVGRLARSGQLRHKRVGNRLLFREQWLIEFLEEGGEATPEPITPEVRLKLARNKNGAPPKGRQGSSPA